MDREEKEGGRKREDRDEGRKEWWMLARHDEWFVCVTKYFKFERKGTCGNGDQLLCHFLISPFIRRNLHTSLAALSTDFILTCLSLLNWHCWFYNYQLSLSDSLQIKVWTMVMKSQVWCEIHPFLLDFCHDMDYIQSSYCLIISFAMKAFTSLFTSQWRHLMTCKNLIGHFDIFSSSSLLFLTVANIVWTTGRLILWVFLKQMMVFNGLLKIAL